MTPPPPGRTISNFPPYEETYVDGTTCGYPSCISGCDYIEPYTYDPSHYAHSTPWCEPSQSRLEELMSRFIHDCEAACERMNNNPSYPVNPPFDPYFPDSNPCEEQPQPNYEELIRRSMSVMDEKFTAQEELLKQLAIAFQSLETRIGQILTMLTRDPGESHHKPDPTHTLRVRPPVLEYKPTIPYPQRLRDEESHFTSVTPFEDSKPDDEELCPQIQYNYPDDNDCFSGLQDELYHTVELKEEGILHDDSPTQVKTVSPSKEQILNQSTPKQPETIWTPELLGREDVEQKPTVETTVRFWDSIPPAPRCIGNTFKSGAYHNFHPHLTTNDGFSISIPGY